MAIFQDAQTDSASLAKLVNEDTDVTTRYGSQPKKSIPKVLREFEESGDAAIESFNQEGAESIAEFDLVIDQYKESRNPRNVGTFAAGFTYEQPNDVGFDGSGQAWGLTDENLLPYTVTAGTTPSEPTFYQASYNTAAQVSTNTSDTVQSFVDSFALKIFQSPTDGLTEIQTRTLLGGEVYEVRKVSDGTLATIYTDKEGLNPITQNGASNVSGSDGVVAFYVADGDYYVEVDSIKSNFSLILKDKFNTVNDAVEYRGIEFLTGSNVYLEDRKASFLVVLTDDVGSGDYSIESTFNTDYSLVLVLNGTDINPEWFGLVYDGDSVSPTDNKDALDDMCSFLKRGVYPEWTGGRVKFSGEKGKVFATSGDHYIPQIDIDGNNVSIRPLNPNNSIFVLDLRFGVQNGRFFQTWTFQNFNMWTDRGFTETTGLDCNHLLDILGGWLILPQVRNLKVSPGFSCRSLVNWELTHTELPSITEVGVPDSVNFENITAQYSLNTSFAISIKGDGLGTGSRLSSVNFKNIYNSIVYPKDFETRANSTNDFGVIRIQDTRLSRSTFSEVYGPQAIKMFGVSKVAISDIYRVYSEFNASVVNDFESMFRSGEYSECNFHNLNMYSINSNLSAPPRFMFAKFTNCKIYNISAQLESIINNAPNANFIDLGPDSSGNEIINKPRIIVGIGISNPPTAGLPYTMTKISAPSDTRMVFCEPKQLKVRAAQSFNSNGTITVASVPESLAEINCFCRVRFSVQFAQISASADLNTEVSGDGITNDPKRTSPVRNYTGTEGSVNFGVEFIGRADINSTPSYNQFSANAFVKFDLHGGLSYDRVDGNSSPTDRAIVYNRTQTFGDLNLQYGSGDYDIKLTVANLINDGGNDSFIVNSVVEYGYSDEYINYY